MPDTTPNNVYLATGNPDTVEVTPTDFTSLGYRTGELGQKFEFNDRRYQIVQLDSGATSATATGVVAANQLAFWKNKATYEVTNNRAQAQGGSGTASYANQVAGVFRIAATARARVNGYGTVICILQKGRAIPVADGGNTFAVGESVIAEADSAAAADRVAVGTAPTYMLLGYATGPAAGGNVNVDLDIPDIV